MPQFVPVAIRERDCSEATELTSTELRVVVALIAARRTGRLGCTVKDLRQLTGIPAGGSNMVRLERAGWTTAWAKVEGTREIIWIVTPKAAPRLELAGWQVLLFSDEELPRVDANVPGFLIEPENTVTLVGPVVADAPGARAEGERCAS